MTKTAERRNVDYALDMMNVPIGRYVFNDKRKYGRRLKYGNVWLNSTQKRKLQRFLNTVFTDYKVTVGETQLSPWAPQYCGTTITFKRKQ